MNNNNNHTTLNNIHGKHNERLSLNLNSLKNKSNDMKLNYINSIAELLYCIDDPKREYYDYFSTFCTIINNNVYTTRCSKVNFTAYFTEQKIVLNFDFVFYILLVRWILY